MERVEYECGDATWTLKQLSEAAKRGLKTEFEKMNDSWRESIEDELEHIPAEKWGEWVWIKLLRNERPVFWKLLFKQLNINEKYPQLS